MDYKIIETLDLVLGVGKSFAKGEHYYFCPFCHHYKPKFAVNVVKGAWQCWKCGARGGKLTNLLRKLDVPSEQIRKFASLINDETFTSLETDVEPVLILPAEYISLTTISNSWKGIRALKYLRSRNITQDDIDRFQIGYCENGRYFNRIIIPSHDSDGKLNYFIARDFMNAAPTAYTNPPVSKNVVAFENQINWNYPIILVEGFFDAMAAKRNSTPLLGKTLSKKLQKKIIQVGVKDVYLALDDDALKETIKIAEYYINEGIRVWLVDIQGKDPSAIGSSMMYKLIKEAKQLSFMDLMQLKMRLCK